MSERMDSDLQIQAIYNKTKDLKSPSDLDALILGKIQTGSEDAAKTADKSWMYLPIAASVILAIALQFNSVDRPDEIANKPVQIVQLPTKNQAVPKPEKDNRNRLPETFFLPQDDFNSKIVPACNGQLVEPESVVDQILESPSLKPKNKKSKLPIKLIYPNSTTNNSPACDNVSRQVFKK